MTLKNIIFIDSRVDNYQTLIAHLPENTGWFLLNPDEDGLQQMAGILSGYANINSVQLVSHASAGALYLGNTRLDSGNLVHYQAQLQAIGSALTPSGDILLYGCDLAQSATGKLLVDAIAAATQADVAASTNITGNAGDWLLEYATGSIEASTPFDGSYNGNLAATHNIYGTSGNDNLTGTDADDGIYSYDGSDTVHGGAGNDYIGGADYYDPATQTWLKDAVSNQLYGDAGNDTIYGGQGQDSLDGGIGDDILGGNAGNDKLLGAAGNDTLYAGAGNDSLYGGVGDDVLYGDDGNDLLDGGSGKNSLNGGAGDDHYLIRNITDSIYDSGGTNDKATIYVDFYKSAMDSIETLEYAPGVQVLPYWVDGLASGWGSAPALSGQNKVMYYCFPDTMPADTRAADQTGWRSFTTAERATVRETLSYISTLIDVTFQETTDPTAAKTITFARNQQTSAGYAYYPDTNSSSALFLDVDYTYPIKSLLLHELGHSLGMKHPFEGSSTLSTAEDNGSWTMMSYSGWTSDEIYRPLDIATLQYLYGAAPTSRAGNDNYILKTDATNIIWDGGGNDTIDGSALTDNLTLHLGVASWDYVGSKGTYISSAGQITVNIGTLIENAIGGSGNDQITGNAANNALTGGAGNDSLNGSGGIDTLIGGLGDDRYDVNISTDVITELAAQGTDTVYSTAASYVMGANIENGRINTTSAANLTGNAQSNYLYAGAGNNVIDGASGTDTVSYRYATSGTTGVTVSLATTAAQATGGSGSDTLKNIERLVGSNYADQLTGSAGSNVLSGGSGNDTLSGGAGNDALAGGTGADRLAGGMGADRFDFNALSELGLSSTTRDTITDFKTSEADKIDLLDVDANTALAGDQAFSFLGALTAFTGDATGKLRFDAAAHILYGSTDADTAAEFAIVLTGVTSLSAADLVL
jgi:Ca2+-binding RTX toxin-like protein